MQLHRGYNSSASSRLQASCKPILGVMGSKGPRCRFFFCCPLQEVVLEDASVINAIQKLHSLENPEKQREGLKLLLDSYKETLDNGGNERDWALEWVHSGALHALAGIASQLNTRVDATRLLLVCRATLRILNILAPESHHFGTILNRMWNTIRDKGEGALATYHLMLRIFELPTVRQAAIQTGFVNLLWARYESSCAVLGSQGNRPLVLTGSIDDLIDDLFYDSPGDETGDEAIVKVSNCDSQSSAAPVVPRLNFTWLNRRRTALLPESIGNQSNKVAVAWNDDTGIWPHLSPHQARASDTGQDNGCALFSIFDEEALRAPSGAVSPVSNILRIDESSGSSHVCGGELMPEYFGAKELGLNVSDAELIVRCFPSGDPRCVWGLPNNHILFKDVPATEREKCAILEGILMLSPLNSPDFTTIPGQITKTLLADFNAMMKCPGLEKESLRNANQLLFKIACIHEFTSRSGITETVQGCASLQRAVISRGHVQDDLFLLVKEHLEEFASNRRPGKTIFANLAHQLDILLDYIAASYSSHPAKSLMEVLDITLQSIENQFTRCGRPKNWGAQTLQAYVRLLKLYSVVLHRAGNCNECYPLISRWFGDGSASRLLEGAAFQLMLERTEGLMPEEGFKGQLVLWEFLQALAEAIKLQMKKSTSTREGVVRESNSHELDACVTCTTSWDYLLAPRTGLVSKVLGMKAGEDASQGVDKCLHAQVLIFLKKTMPLIENSFMADRGVAKFYIELHISKFASLYQDILNKTDVGVLCKFHLEVLISMMKCRHCHILEEIQATGFANYLQYEISNEALDTEFVHNPQSLKEMWHRPENPLLGMNAAHASSPEIKEVDLFLQEEDMVHASECTKEFVSIDEIDKVISHEQEGSGAQTGGYDDLSMNLDNENSCEERSKPGHPHKETLPPGVDAKVVVTNTSFNDSELSFKPGKGSLSQDAWPIGLAITGDLEEDLLRWEAAETQISEPENTSLEEEEAVLESDSDDGLPLPSARPRPPFVPPLTLCSSKVDHSGNGSSAGCPSLSFRTLCAADGSFCSAMDQHTDLQQEKCRDASFSLPPNLQLWRNDDVHLATIQFLLEFLLLLDSVVGSPRDKLEALAGVNDMAQALFCHLNHERFAHLVNRLNNDVAAKSPRYQNFLRLFLKSSFDSGLYKTINRVHHGERTQVQQCRILAQGDGIPSTCIVKVVDFPVDHTSTGCILDIFSEVSILCTLRSHESFSHLYDFGATQDSIFLVLKEYKCTLLEWRKQLPDRCPWAVRLLLVVFREILLNVKKLHSLSIIHFDLKCINILLDPLPTYDEPSFWVPPTEAPGFKIILADFGEAKCYGGRDSAVTVRTRGTEYLQSPEMLEVSSKAPQDFDRRRVVGAGSPTDVWGLGCLLYELITGSMLQYDTDWMRFYVRVVQDKMPIIEESKARLIDESCRPTILSLLQFILVRNQEWRPSVCAMIDRVDSILNSSVLPEYTPPTRSSQTNNPAGSLRYFSSAGRDYQDIVDLQKRMKFSFGFTRINRYMFVHIGEDLGFLQDPKELAGMNVALVIVLEESRDSHEHKKQLIGACSRLGMEGVVADFSGDFDKQSISSLVRLLEPYVHDGDKNVLVCSVEGSQILNKVLVEVLACLRDCSQFEAQLDVCRRAAPCK